MIKFIKKEKTFLKENVFFLNLIDKFICLLAIFPIIIFILWPMVALFVKSIFPNGSFTLKLYSDIFAVQFPLVVRSVLVCLLSTTLTTIFSVVIAIYIGFSKKILKQLLTSIMMLTMISPPFVSSLSYILLFGKRGIITSDILNLNVNPYGWHGIVFMQTFGEISLATLILIAGLTTIPQNTIEAAKDLGSKPSEVLIRVILPLLKPSIIAVYFITFVKNIADFSTPIIVGGNFQMLATEAYRGVIGYGEIDKAAAISFLILFPIIIIFLLYRKQLTNSNVMSNFSTKSNRLEENLYKLPKKISSLFGLITVLFTFYMLLQYFTIFITAISNNKGHVFRWTTEYLNAFSFSKSETLIRSVYYSLIAGLVASFLGVIFSYYIDRRKVPFSKSLDFIAALPYIFPGPFFGIAYLLAFHNPPLLLTGTGAIVVINCIFRQMPVTTKVASANLNQISFIAEDAARDLGTPKAIVFFKVILPQLKPAFLVGFINTFTATMTTVGAIIFLITPSAKVATVELFNVIRDGEYHIAAVISSLIIFVTLTVNIIFSLILLKNKK